MPNFSKMNSLKEEIKRKREWVDNTVVLYVHKMSKYINVVLYVPHLDKESPPAV